ncbi:hypothetical protein [Cesiribacter andamanensis]|uniref:Phosphate/sulfate permease n=1 Tax=Cesiribacter andamanensis AMV16 TaxID=1279009 RepID=M7N5F4_9BACT|nr:hypothetical protein [Cesiribacter andamanensis]EMR03848.1 hypothetical protein ADICEAN_00997 [Cesiribacter andamanensis AMV16]
MANNINQRITWDKLSRRPLQIFTLVKGERNFLILIATLFIVCAFVTPFPHVAMWVGFAIAGYSAIANDSIQTLGTFIASNSQRKWWILWLYMGLIFVATMLYSWLVYDGDVSYQRLSSKGFDEAPTSFSFLQLAAPIFLLLLTRLRMPVSTTFLILSAFATTSDAILSVLSKSMVGYLIAFFAALLVWFAVARFTKNLFKGKPASWWLPVQWVTSGALWFTWLSQDAANIAIFLPRSLSVEQFIAFTGYIFLGLGLLFYLKGDKIQSVVSEKAGIADIRAATIVDFIYALLLFYFKTLSTIPMSTTWVFLGLLAGRELAISISKKRKKKKYRSTKRTMRMIGKDLLYALIGLLVAVILALSINAQVRAEVFDALF